MITVEQIKPYFPKISDDILLQELEKIDQEAILQKLENNITLAIWDKETPINGVQANKILSNPDFQNSDSVYLIEENNRVIIIQPFNPKTSGFQPMNEETALQIGNEQRKDIIESRQESEVVRIIEESIS